MGSLYTTADKLDSLWRKGSFQAIYVYIAFSLCSFQIIKNQAPADTAKGKSLRMPGIPGISTDHLLDLVPSPKSVKSLPLSVLLVSTGLPLSHSPSPDSSWHPLLQHLSQEAHKVKWTTPGQPPSWGWRWLTFLSWGSNNAQYTSCSHSDKWHPWVYGNMLLHVHPSCWRKHYKYSK